MSYHDKIKQFSNNEFLPEGWFWLERSKKLKKNKAIPVKFFNKDFVVYRDDENQVHVFDAFCPHMGAHLCDGFVEGKAIRCKFHYWKFDQDGTCIEIPAQKDLSTVRPLKKYRSEEKYDLIWLWTGDPLSNEEIPVPLELIGQDIDFKLGGEYQKKCHPNVMMINAIDAQHFKSVHNLVVDLNMEPRIISENCIQLANTTPFPQSNFILRFLSRFYKKQLTYELTYWWGNVGNVTLGPDFLHFYILFALRPTPDGKSEGQTILLTRKRPLGFLINPVILFLTNLVGAYFAKGDTIIFSRINFKFKTPIKADNAIIQFIEHYEKQSQSSSEFC